MLQLTFSANNCRLYPGTNSRDHIRGQVDVLIGWLIVGIVCGLISGLVTWLVDGVVGWLVGGVVGGIFVGIVGG